VFKCVFFGECKRGYKYDTAPAPPHTYIRIHPRLYVCLSRPHQVVVPGLTESWGATRDPPEQDIPYCTLKDFPSEINHTIVWATEQLKANFLDGDTGEESRNA